jgi:hypothetical protein
MRPVSPAAGIIAVALVLAAAATASAANHYPPGPAYRACGDSVTIFQVQQADATLNPCYPALGDTVWGVRGIITAFRTRGGTAGEFYLENSVAADYMGVRVLTTTHLEGLGFAAGDSVAVCGISEDYQRESQIQGAMGTSLTVRRLGGGYVLPAWREGTTSDYRWAPAAGAGSAFATCNPREGERVKVVGPLRVARNTAGAGLYAIGNWLLVNADGTAPGDSVLVDGYTLVPTTLTTPPLGMVLASVHGILHRTTNSGVDCWTISLVDEGNDVLPVSADLVAAFPLADDRLRLVFDANLDEATAENAAHYELGSHGAGSTVDAAELVGGAGNVVDLTITGTLPRLARETISAEDIGVAVSPSWLMWRQTLSFVTGVLAVAEVQAPDPDSLGGTTCLDRSRFAGGGTAFGPMLSVRGVTLGTWGDYASLEDAAGGERGGLVLFYPSPVALTAGHQYLVAGAVQEFHTETQLTHIVQVVDEGAASVPAPLTETLAVLADASCDATQSLTNAEDCEGLLVRAEGLKVVPFDTEPTIPARGGPFRVVQLPDGADTLLVSALGDPYPDYTPIVGAFVNVTGVLRLDGETPGILPRSPSDIEPTNVGVAPNPDRVTFAVAPNPARVSLVSFSLPRAANVDLSVFDLAGRRLATLAHGELPAGRYSREWRGGELGAGIRFVRLRVGGETYCLRTVTLR